MTKISDININTAEYKNNDINADTDKGRKTETNINNHKTSDAGIEMLISGLSEMGLDITKNQIEQFISFYEILVEKNKVMNLTGITEFNDVVVKHFIDSVAMVKAVSKDRLNSETGIIDVGTGAGFPGIPLKIVFPEIKITLLDSLNKRINFLKEVTDKLGLKNIELVHGRSEDLGKNVQYREKYDICVSRAVANLSSLCEYCIPFVKKGGVFISYKGGESHEEVVDSLKAIEVLGGKLRKEISYTVPHSDYGRTLVVIEKSMPTPKKYPRKAGIPVKEPIR